LGAQLGLAELACAAVDPAAELLRHQVHPVTDAEGRYPELEEARVDARRSLGIDRRRAPREDDRGRVAGPDLRSGGAVRDELGVDARLANAPRDQLRVLPPEVEHEHRALL